MGFVISSDTFRDVDLKKFIGKVFIYIQPDIIKYKSEEFVSFSRVSNKIKSSLNDINVTNRCPVFGMFEKTSTGAKIYLHVNWKKIIELECAVGLALKNSNVYYLLKNVVVVGLDDELYKEMIGVMKDKEDKEF